MNTEHSVEETVKRLRQHRMMKDLPESELTWIAERGAWHHFEGGQVIVEQGYEWRPGGAFGLEILMSGQLAVWVDHRTRKTMEWHGGDITGVLPFSRMERSRSDVMAETDAETFSLDIAYHSELIRECPELTAACVHAMVDRARAFKAGDLQNEKMVSLGKLSAGLAHELNNPAAAVARSARLLQTRMAEADRATRALARVGLTEAQLAAVDVVRESCALAAPDVSLSPLERSDREDEIAEWLDAHGVTGAAVESLAETSVTLEALDKLASQIEGEALDAALDWVAAGCAVRTLAVENQNAGRKISDLVSAMKRLTHMDRAPESEPIHVEQGIRDTLMVVTHKARDKSVSIKVDVAPDLPLVRAVGGELEQVWMNIIDNALDAVDLGGHVSITAKPEGRSLVVRVIDDGPGIPAGIQTLVFDAFYTTKAQGKGTGLGLEIARTHIRKHGGDIDFTSRPGRTEFRIALPLADAGAHAIPAPRAT